MEVAFSYLRKTVVFNYVLYYRYNKNPLIYAHFFSSMVAEPCYKAMGEQIIKNKAVRETVFQILGVLVKKYNHGATCLIQLVQVTLLSFFSFVVACLSGITAGTIQQHQ